MFLSEVSNFFLKTFMNHSSVICFDLMQLYDVYYAVSYLLFNCHDHLIHTLFLWSVGSGTLLLLLNCVYY